MNKRKLSLLCAVSLTLASSMHASFFTKADAKSLTDKILMLIADAFRSIPARSFIEAQNAKRDLFEKVTAGLRPNALVPFSGSAIQKFSTDFVLGQGTIVDQSVKNIGLAQQAMNKLVNPEAVGSLVSSVAPVIAGCAKHAALGRAYVGTAIAAPLMAAGATLKGMYDHNAVLDAAEAVNIVAPVIDVVAPVVKAGFKAQALTFMQTHKKDTAIVAGIATLLGSAYLYNNYRAKQTPVVTAPVVATTPVVEKASEVKAPVAKLTVAQIAQENGTNLQGIIDALKAHGYTKVQVTAKDLKSAGKLNDGQCRFIIAQTR